MHSSPASPTGSSRVPVSTSTIFMSVSGNGRPIVPSLRTRELRRRVRHRRGFRQAVAFVQRPADAPLELLHHLDRTRRAAAVEVAHEVEPVLGDLRMIEQRDEHRRHGGEVGRPEVADRGEHRVGIVLRDG